MKIFIAGATGTLGIPLIREIAGCGGHEITGLTKTEEKRRMLEELGARVAVADALDGTALTDAIGKAGPDLVIDLLTAIPKRGPMRSEDMTATDRLRVQGTDNLLRASIAAGVKRIVAESVVFVYGYGDHGPQKLTEQDELKPEQFPETQETVGALRYLEKSLFEANQKGLIETIALRFGLLYGPEVPATQATLQMIREGKISVLNKGDGSKPWVYVDDAVTAILAAVERGRPGEIYNIVDDQAAGYRDFILVAAHMLGAPRPRSVPSWFMRLRSPYSAILLSTQLLVSNEKAKRDLGWSLRFPDYQAGLQEIATELLLKRVA